ncbi:hypothetical protein DVH05_023841, partial [Phytophthora capsici]
VAFSVETAFSKLWIQSDAFAKSILDAAGATNISLPAWDVKPVSYTAVTKPCMFDGSRLVSYIHNKKYMVGPSVIPTAQTQRYAYTRGSRLIVSTTTCVSDVPYCDYFRVEHRWVFSATKKTGVCSVQVGLRLQWLKSTWLKKQIESTTVSEAKEAIKTWLSAALHVTKQKAATGGAVDSLAPARTSTTEMQEDSLSKVNTPQIAVTTDSLSVLGHAGLPTQLHPTIQVAVIICALMFVYTMYRVCVAMDQMQVLTRESLLQQRQQQEVLMELLQQLGNMREK